MGIYVAAYLMIGALTAGTLWVAIGQGLNKRQTHPHVDEAVTALEKPTGTIPGGMATVALITVLLWPAIVAALIRQKVQGRRD